MEIIRKGALDDQSYLLGRLCWSNFFTEAHEISQNPFLDAIFGEPVVVYNLIKTSILQGS